MLFNVDLTRERLPYLKVDAIGYGAKDTGEMGGGAAAAILAAAGQKIIEDARKKLAATDRRVGVAVVTDAHTLRQSGIQWVCHIVSIITKTPQGDWCPYPEKLYDGMLSGLNQVLATGATSFAVSALATGEGRVSSNDAARLMLTAIREFQRVKENRKLKIVLSLPTYDDFTAFKLFSSRI